MKNFREIFHLVMTTWQGLAFWYMCCFLAFFVVLPVTANYITWLLNWLS